MPRMCKTSWVTVLSWVSQASFVVLSVNGFKLTLPARGLIMFLIKMTMTSFQIVYLPVSGWRKHAEAVARVALFLSGFAITKIIRSASIFKPRRLGTIYASLQYSSVSTSLLCSGIIERTSFKFLNTLGISISEMNSLCSALRLAIPTRENENWALKELRIATWEVGLDPYWLEGSRCV